MHSGRIVKLFPDRSNLSTLADHITSIGRNWSNKLHSLRYISFGIVVTMELNLSSSLGNMQPSTILSDRFGILQMLLGNLSIPFPSIINKKSPVRFWNERGTFSMEVFFKAIWVIFFISPKISGKILRLSQNESLSSWREADFRGGKLCKIYSKRKIINEWKSILILYKTREGHGRSFEFGWLRWHIRGNRYKKI
jgi:hypothetical protein